MKEIVFATHNADKAREIQKILLGWNVKTLDDIGCSEEIPEEQDSLEGNALQKAEYVWDKYEIPCFSDDTGLEVKALGGRPGVYSARYAGENCSYQDNVLKMLEEMDGKSNREAQFRTSICLILPNNPPVYFDGIAKGVILQKQQGSGGFGYDPIFQPEGFEKSFAEMSLAEKNKISHRAKAVSKLADFLNKEATAL